MPWAVACSSARRTARSSVSSPRSRYAGRAPAGPGSPAGEIQAAVQSVAAITSRVNGNPGASGTRNCRCQPSASAVLGEEPLEQGGRLVGAPAGQHLWPVVEPAIPYDVPEAADRAGLRVPGAEDDPLDPAEHRRAGAHRAGLEGHDQRVPVEAPLAVGAGGLTQRDDLGVPGRVVLGLAQVAAAPDRRTVRGQDDGADRYVVGRQRGARLVEGSGHRAIPLSSTHAEVRPIASSKSSPKPSLRATSESISSG